MSEKMITQPKLTKLWNPSDGQMRVAGLMSGSGTNLEELIKLERKLESQFEKSPFEVVLVYGTNSKCNALQIGKKFDITAHVESYRDSLHGRAYGDMEARTEYDMKTVKKLNEDGVHFIAYGGYMLIATPVLVNSILGVNVHPANLSIEEHGVRKYTGADAVAKAIRAGEKELRSTTHIMTEKVDDGPLIFISPPLPVELPPNFDKDNLEMVARISGEHKDKLKKVGDHIIFPRTVLDTALGRIAKDETGLMYYDGKAIPYGHLVG